jgi:hypothetical protein
VGVLGFSASAFGESVTFTYAGEQKEFVVPAGVSSIHVVATGAAGASLQGAGGGGKGAVVSGDVSVKPGPLYIDVGGTPQSDMPSVGGFNGGGSAPGGGGGGGASDVRTIASGQSGSLASRLVVAAGGGGGAQSGYCIAGEGGNAEARGTNGEGEESFLCFGSPAYSSTGGGAGTQTEGGTAGSPGGEAGALGQGGSSGEDGGAGGGGLYGGGGGGAFDENEAGGGGGGGGSNLLPAGGEAKTAETGAEPSVTVTYTAPPACTAVNGVGHIAPKGKEGENLRVHLSTSGGTFTTTTPNGAAQFTLRTLSSASCVVIPGGLEFSGRGAATMGGPKHTGYEMVFSFATGGAKTYLSLEVTKGATVVYKVTHEPLTKGSKVKIS